MLCGDLCARPKIKLPTHKYLPVILLLEERGHLRLGRVGEGRVHSGLNACIETVAW